jgi:hypothetical protein
LKSKIEEYAKIRKSLKGVGYSFDLILASTKEFDFYSTHWRNSIFREIKEKGKTIYER